MFCFLGPIFYTQWGETELDKSGKTEYATASTTYTVDGVTYSLRQTTETHLIDNFLSAPSGEHPLGTDDQGYDVLARLMYGGRVSLLVSFMTVILMTIFGVILGGLAGYFGGVVDKRRFLDYTAIVATNQGGGERCPGRPIKMTI